MEFIIPLGLLALFLTSVVWVYRDSSTLLERGCTAMGGLSPGFWCLMCILFWVPMFPIYLLCRVFVTMPPAAGVQAEPPAADRFPCPECGESIASAAKHCRFCQCIISDKDRPGAAQAPAPAAEPKRRRRFAK